jgi:hypothetical protein
MTDRKTITLAEFQEACKGQGVPREHIATKCPVCETVQSMADLVAAGVEEPDRTFGFSCIGRFTGAGAKKRGEAPGRGCDWTLGGLLTIHTLEVETPDGKKHPYFELATPEEAHSHMRAHGVSEDDAECAAGQRSSGHDQRVPMKGGA